MRSIERHYEALRVWRPAKRFNLKAEIKEANIQRRRLWREEKQRKKIEREHKNQAEDYGSLDREYRAVLNNN